MNLISQFWHILKQYENENINICSSPHDKLFNYGM